MKQLKPGQLCTIKGHVYRCKKQTKDREYIGLACQSCKQDNQRLCVMTSAFHSFMKGSMECGKRFGFKYYPVLVK